MLAFALEYRKAVESMTQIKDLGLCDYELEPEEWAIAQQLTDVLKVSQIVQNIDWMHHCQRRQWLAAYLIISLLIVYDWHITDIVFDRSLKMLRFFFRDQLPASLL